MGQVVETYDGWYAYHDFRTIDWATWKAVGSSERDEITKELLDLTQTFATVEKEHKGSFGQYSIFGHKADLMFIYLRPTLEELNEVKASFQKTRFADYTKAEYSFISVVELSAYQVRPGTDPETDPMVQRRLKPSLPQTEYVSFYPMNKKREGADNWYMLPMDERRAMIKDHGLIGRSYAGQVRQIITGSIGFDDWEWGVSLFSDDPLQFKKIVHEMRFDEASARFGEFGAFYTGYRLSADALEDYIGV